jgi:hypothetical protein
MRINELLVESQQLDEGPFTQAIGKVGGKIARGVANVGKDLKTGFKAGYSGEQPPVDATTAPAAASGVKQGLSKAFSNPATTSTPADANTTAAPAVADPAAEKAAKIGVRQINKIIPTLRTRDLLSLQANLEKAIASKKKEPVAAPAAAPTTDPTATPAAVATPADTKVKQSRAKKPTQAEIDADRARLMGPNSESAVKKGRVVAESFSLYRQH